MLGVIFLRRHRRSPPCRREGRAVGVSIPPGPTDSSRSSRGPGPSQALGLPGPAGPGRPRRHRDLTMALIISQVLAQPRNWPPMPSQVAGAANSPPRSTPRVQSPHPGLAVRVVPAQARRDRHLPTYTHNPFGGRRSGAGQVRDEFDDRFDNPFGTSHDSHQRVRLGPRTTARPDQSWPHPARVDAPRHLPDVLLGCTPTPIDRRHIAPPSPEFFGGGSYGDSGKSPLADLGCSPVEPAACSDQVRFTGHPDAFADADKRMYGRASTSSGRRS